MSYVYAVERERLFTESGQRMFLKVRDKAHKLLAEAGAFRAQHAWGGVAGDSWMMLACLDRLLELKEMREVNPGEYAGQHRLFIPNRED